MGESEFFQAAEARSVSVVCGRRTAISRYGENPGLIKRFSVRAVDAAFSSGTPLTWSDSTGLNPDSRDSQSAAGMFFDSRNYLFAEGNEGVTVFRPDGTSGTFDVGKLRASPSEAWGSWSKSLASGSHGTGSRR